MKVGLQSVKGAKSKNQLPIKHATLSMCVSTQSISVLVTRIARILGLHHCNIVVTLGRCQLIDTSINLKWAMKEKT